MCPNSLLIASMWVIGWTRRILPEGEGRAPMLQAYQEVWKRLGDETVLINAARLMVKPGRLLQWVDLWFWGKAAFIQGDKKRKIAIVSMKMPVIVCYIYHGVSIYKLVYIFYNVMRQFGYDFNHITSFCNCINSSCGLPDCGNVRWLSRDLKVFCEMTYLMMK